MVVIIVPTALITTLIAVIGGDKGVWAEIRLRDSS